MFSKKWNVFSIKMLFLVLFGLLSISKSQAQFDIDGGFIVDNGCNKLKVYWGSGNNACVTPYYNEIAMYVNGTQSYYGSWNHPDGLWGNCTYNTSHLAPGTQLNVYLAIRHMGFWCDYWVNSSTLVFTVPGNQPINNVRADDGKYGNKINIYWDRLSTICYDNLTYKVYCNGSLLATLPGTQLSYTHTGLQPGVTNTYVVRSVANGVELSGVSSVTDNGSTFDINLHATNSDSTKVLLTWNNFSNVNSPNGFTIERYNGVSSTPIADLNFNNYTSHEDFMSTQGLIPGYTYRYNIFVKPLASTGIVDTVYGKVRPNGKIIGSVKTPSTIANPNGVGIPNVRVVATLRGTALPSDPTSVYEAITNSNGEYVIPNIYYYTSATFKVQPILAGRTFSPDSMDVTLTSANPALANFTDLSSFIVSGNISQGTCPVEGVDMYLNNQSQGVLTDENGDYSLTISTGGTYSIKPIFENNLFNPDSQVVTITADMTGINFSDTTKYVLEGHVTASCETYIGVAQIRFYSNDNGTCFDQTVTTDANGYYSLVLPARRINITMTNFTSVDELLVNSIAVQAYFSNINEIDLTHYNANTFHNDSTTLNFVYRVPPTIEMLGLNTYQTCAGELLPILQQHRPVVIEFAAWDSFNGSNCPAGDGYILISENISSTNMDINTDTIYYTQGEAIEYSLIPGTPNIIAPHKKFIEAILVRDNQKDTAYADVVVVGHRPRSQTFTTVTPQIPFHILHNPPGDGSYSYLAQNTSISNSFTTSFLQEGSVDTYIRAQLGQSISVEVGFIAGVSTEVSTQLDVTGSFGIGACGLTEDASTVTSTANQMFQTSGNVNITGGDGDVYVGGALNMLYAASDVLEYNFDLCQFETDVTLVMQPTGISTTFMYTEEHIVNSIIPELENITNYYLQQQEQDSASFFQDQLDMWQQIVDANHDNITAADSIDNVSFSAGVLNDYSVETVRSNSHSFDFNFYLDYGVAVDIGASVAGTGLYGGVAVHGRSTWGSVVASETSTSTTVGYVLGDDDLGDNYSVNILEDNVYGVPAFKLIGGKSSCPWEPGTLPREGLQLISNTYSQSVEESQSAVFVLQLGNLSENNETRTYDLVFDHTSNPYGAILTIGGSPVVGNVPYPYTIAPMGSATATITIEKGPIEQVYNGLKFTLQSQCDEQINDDIFLNVNFYEQYTLNIAVSGSGTTNLPLGNNMYNEGTTAILYASPSLGSVFLKWVVGTTEYTSQAIEVLMDENKTATAYFVPTTLPQFTLTVTKSGDGNTMPPTGTYIINNDSSITLTAIPDIGNVFAKWEINGVDYLDNIISITIDSNTTANACFIQTYNVQIQPICLVSVDSIQNANLIVWEKVQSLGISHYKVYRETSIPNAYQFVASIPYDSMSTYLDIDANPMIRAWRYKLSAVDSSGNESLLSPHHKTMHLTVNQGTGTTFNIIWDDYEGFSYNSFIIERYLPSTGWVILDTLPNTLHSYTNIAPSIAGIAYIVRVDAPSQCYPSSTSAKEIGGPYSSSYSNMEDESILVSVDDNDDYIIDMMVYPNPANKYITIKAKSDFSNNLNINIINSLGQVVFHSSNNTNNELKVDVSELASGMYVITLSTGDQTSTCKLQIIR
ncbi:MAG: hypothetical protein CVU05_07200 [Bacteroidetes bacterium HGW-Bacteroidetes-21]|jgi:hypothetical protein|nr:MAG: hypothetical protein CVU05_07200 [Bacteroidetes bacterium HGW-Bacteroidetes-21]